MIVGLLNDRQLRHERDAAVVGAKAEPQERRRAVEARAARWTLRRYLGQLVRALAARVRIVDHARVCHVA